jgi:DNA modification methylase
MEKDDMTDAYEQLLRDKITFDSACGYDIDESEINPILLPHQRDIVRWAVHGGRRAIFASFGLGKSVMQLETCRLTRTRAGGRALIVCPLGVRQEFKRDAAMLGQTSKFVRWSSEVTDEGAEPDIWLTNYESIRDGRLDPDLFTVISLDEGAVLRSLGTKTFQTFRLLCDSVPHRFVATATPSPNEHTELTNYADFLGVLDRGQSLTRWFKRNSSKAGELTLMPHRLDEFWAWVATWSVWLQKPSDLGYSDDGYELPEIDVRYHEIEVDALNSLTFENQGQGVLVRDGALGVVGASKEKRDSITARVEKAKEIVDADPDDHFVLWHHLESERQVIARTIPDVCEVYGSLDLEERERRIVAFSDGEERLLATKPSLSGSGCNFQRHCHRAIFVGIDFKFADFIQACHRIQRFQQDRPVRIDIIHADTERQVVAELNRKWKQHREMTATMSKLIQERGLSREAMSEALARSIGTERVAASGEGWEIVNDDTVRETRRMATESVDLIWSSPPYGTQYEYVAAIEDFGHNDDNDAFWRQMDHLTPELHRILKPGRMCVFHVKDRIRFGNMNGRGYATVQPFHAEAIMHMIKHGFGFVGEITLDTDVVRENNQTYRLGWSEVVKDRTKLGVGTPEKVLLFRKNQTDRTTGAADEPVVKTKEQYTLARWQIDAASLWKSSGNRFITPEELEGLPVPTLRKVFAAACESRIYDYEAHVALGDDFAARGRLPTTFAMLAPTTESPVIWTEVNRLQSLNTSQAQKGRELHVCPTPTDVLDRCINQWSNPGDLVYDPFGGLGSCVVRALALGRRGKCTELNPLYWGDAVKYAQAMENKVNMPSLFDAFDVLAEEVA